MTSYYKFTSEKSARAIARITNFVDENEQATVGQIAEAMKMSKTTIAAYLKHLIDQKEMRCSSPSLRLPDGAWIAALYALVDEGRNSSSLDRDPQQVVLRTQKWKPNHVRDLLHCYLFGFPDTMITA